MKGVRTGWVTSSSEVSVGTTWKMLLEKSNGWEAEKTCLWPLKSPETREMKLLQS